ncbi:ATP-grasp fold amidoligase family protein [Halalkalibacter lacteus]|uniref:ATP-grasp fold amidoligase family protein n=1 Tax=Halalkalibacter lacteus TaxID=3090663 RepID=UPI002FC5A444
MSILSALKKNEQIVPLYDFLKEFYYKNLISDERLIRKRFKERVGREVDLEKPVYFNDKLQWLKINWRDPLATKCADKYEVRDIIKERIGDEYLNELYAVYDSVDEINIDKLPKSFVLKGTHGSGFNLICKDKTQINWNEELIKMKRWFKNNYYWQNREWVYKEIKPRIISEKFIEQEGGAELRDYRFFCFNGEPKFISVDFSITNKQKTRRNLYDLDWNFMEGEISYPKELSIKVDKPTKLDEMINLSRKISTGFPHTRVDFYFINEKIIFGEITFFHQSGMGKIKSIEFEKEMGNWLNLDGIN